MTTTKLKLIPDGVLLNPNFAGHVRSKFALIGKKVNLPQSVDRVNKDFELCYSLMDIRLFFFHNHLTADHFGEILSMYYFDHQWNLCKICPFPTSGGFKGSEVIWTLPKTRERKPGDYNISLKFISPSMALIGDGMGIMYILDTGNRNNTVPFSVCFSEEVAGPDQPFFVMDAVTRTNNKGIEEIHALLVSVHRVDTCEKYLVTIHWVTFCKIGGTWRQEAIRQVRTRGHIQYAYLSTDCETIIVICDRECYFVLNSDFPIAAKNAKPKKKIYRWSQDSLQIFFEIHLPDTAEKDLFLFYHDNKNINASYAKTQLVLGKFYDEIKFQSTVWCWQGNVFQCIFQKSKSGQMWPVLVKNDVNGEYVARDPALSVNRKCAHICCLDECTLSRTEFGELAGCTTLYRLNGTTNEVTHIAKLNAKIIFETPRSARNVPPAFGFACDYDLCFWRPEDTDEGFSLTHEGTKLGVVTFLAGMTQKYIQWTPDLSSMVINCIPPDPLCILEFGNTSKKHTNASTRRLTRDKGIIMESVLPVNTPILTDVLGMYYAERTIFLLCRQHFFMIHHPNINEVKIK